MPILKKYQNSKVYQVKYFIDEIIEKFDLSKVEKVEKISSKNIADIKQEKPTKNLKKEFETPLGTVACGLNANNFGSFVDKKQYANGIGEIFSFPAHTVEMITFRLKLPLYNGEMLEDSCGWIFRIEKIVEIQENLDIYCLLDKIDKKVELGPNTGEHLDAIIVENEEWVLHIGTEDGDMLGYRAEDDDWFPKRLTEWLDIYNSITKIEENGFVTKIPHLQKGEKIHLHYLVALEQRKEESISTWLAIDQSKKNLEAWIGL